MRTILLELERTWNHLNDIAAVCAGVGLAAGNKLRWADRSARGASTRTTAPLPLRHGPGRRQLPLRRRRRRLGGAGGASGDPRRGALRLARALLNASFQDRLDASASSELTTPQGSAPSGLLRVPLASEDARTGARARLAYNGFAPVPPRRPVGDVRARLEQRALELPQSIELLDTLLDGPVEPTAARRGSEESRIGIGRVESLPAVRTSCIVERDGDRIARLRLRTGSYANWPVVAFAAADNMLPDFPLINKSFELCYACADR